MTRGKRNDATCAADGCESRSWGVGLCQKHYTRMRRYGTTADPAIPTVDERFWAKVAKAGGNGCWEWTGAARNDLGYGSFSLTRGRTVAAYRYSYETLVGPIPAGAHLDHLCRNPRCVNPNHLEPVSPRENILRGVGAPARNLRKTHCVRGHEFTPDNTRFENGGRRRVCKQCKRIQNSRRVS